MEASPLEKSSKASEEHASKRKKNIHSTFFNKVRIPSSSSKNTVDRLPQLDPQFDNSTPDVNSSIFKDNVQSLEELGLGSRDAPCPSVGTFSVKTGTVDCLEGQSDNALSISVSCQEQFNFTLLVEVPVEPVGASACPNLKTASRLDDATPNVISKDSIEGLKSVASVTKKATKERGKKRGIRSFFKGVWKCMKRPFHRQNKVELFVPPPELDEPELSPVPESSDCVSVNESIRDLYKVKKIIGEGGYGKVYEGIRISDGKKVAIKCVQKTTQDQYLQTDVHPEPLLTEVALMLKMRQGPISPLVIQLYDWFEHPETFTLVMEYPDPCESLLDFVNHNPNMNESTAWLIMFQAVQALQHCIERGVFHNDIHPENFLLRKHTLELKLIDFGCGHLLSSEGYDGSQYIGIKDYYPPELFTIGKFHAISTNVWALGMLLYEMMNVCSPFRNITEVLQAEIKFENPDLSEECRDLIVRCLTRDPSKRPTFEQILQHDWFKTVAPKMKRGFRLKHQIEKA